MNKLFLRKFGIGAILCWLVVVGFVSQEAFAIQNLKIGDPMPTFSLPRADKVSESYGSEQFKGQPTVIVFWRSHQKLSFGALSDLRAIAKEIGQSKLRIIAVDTSRSSAQEVQDALSGKGLSFPILLDPQRELYGKVGVIVCPTTLILDAQGIMRFVIASHPRQFSRIVRGRLRYILGEITEQEMDKEIEPTILKIEHDVTAAWRMYNLGKKLQTEGKSQEAASMYEKAVSQSPSLPEARCALGFMKLATGELNAAAGHFQTAITHQPSSSNARLGQAAVLARSGQSQKAEQILLSLLGQKSIAVRVRYELGRIYHSRGEIYKAVTFFQDALSTMFPEPRLPSIKPAAATQPVADIKSAKKSNDVSVPVSPVSSGTPRTVEAVQPIVPDPDAQYLGVKRCKKCHLQQWKSWRDTKMAKTFDVLKPGERADIKTSRNLDPQKDYTTDSTCLRCHTNGFGFARGYQVPAPDDAKASQLAKGNEGVGCESCHGPGSKYVSIHEDIQDKQRQYTQAELHEAGGYKESVRVCVVCHHEKAPCIETGYIFEFEKRKDEGTHKHYEKKFLAK